MKRPRASSIYHREGGLTEADEEKIEADAEALEELAQPYEEHSRPRAGSGSTPPTSTCR